ncbi:hypothetical protein [uncultured Mediterranean phage uvMED]|nr:hypothetical protein [uncultured Mediterranean phage uvMED]
MSREQEKQSLKDSSNLVEQTFKNLEKTNTIDNFVKENNITIVNEYSDSNPSMSDKDSWKMNHYKVTLKRKYKLKGNHLDTRYGHKQMTIFYSQGYAISGEPTASGVLECLRSDYSCSRDGFDDFCSNCGYDNDSIKAKKTFTTIERQSRRLKIFLSNGLDSNCLSNIKLIDATKFDQLLECEE